VKSRVYIIISGEVQGVFFRQETKRHAINLNVTGWVRNREDGSVEAVFEGEEQAVQSMVEFCKRGPPRANVTDVKAERETFKNEFDGFNVR
jgi:acylphosphatase